MDPKQAVRVSVCLVSSRAKWHSIAEDKDAALFGAGISAVQAGAGTEDVPYAGSLSHGNRQEKNHHTRRKWK